MQISRILRASIGMVLIVSALIAGSASGARPVDPGYKTYFDGSTTDVTTTPLGGALLAGGGTDSDVGMKWLLGQGGARGVGKYGDVVVLRTSGSNGYNKWLVGFGANSVTSIVISSVAGANSPVVAAAIAKAEIVFIAGGDQATYVRLWSNTALQTAVNQRINAGYPVGGTSAGLAVIGNYVFAALNGTAYSSTVLANPYDATVSLGPALFSVPPILTNVLTDSHFAVRDRMGRLVTFLARLQQDGTASAPRGIGIDEASAVGITQAGTGTVFGTGNGAYLLSVTAVITRTCSSGIPLIYTPVSVQRVPVGQQFAVNSWSNITPGAASAYTLDAANKVLSSRSGSVY